MARLALRIEGRIQGVGFRPFVYREARARKLVGWVQNVRGAVRIEVQGAPDGLADFLAALECGSPAPARLRSVEQLVIEEAPDGDFRILPSTETDTSAAVIPPDLGACAECRAELKGDGRRAGYPFTHCTACGPRYSIVLGLPYDRCRTSLGAFPLCVRCRSEFEDIHDRRFHAQAIACPECGPQLSLLEQGREVASGTSALAAAVAALSTGRILALQGVGGFQLLVDATNPSAVALLRQRKQREAKPLAVMFESLEQLEQYAVPTPAERELLGSAACPIVLVRKGDASLAFQDLARASIAVLAPQVAPRNPYVGSLLPASPLHQLLVERVGRPLVCTSGNLSEEPLCIDVAEASALLSPVADLFLVHDRLVARPLDDSVAQIGARGPELLLRRARGYAPEPVAQTDSQRCVLALGGHLKNTLTLLYRGAFIPSQHIGDLGSERGRARAERTARELVEFFAARPELVTCDEHPDYASTELAERLSNEWGVPLVRVQHHRAHVAAVCAEHALAGPLLGLAWDGTGYGSDGTIWGGEAFVCDGARFERVARLRPFPLPGGEGAAREPRRAALGLLCDLGQSGWAKRWYGAAELALRVRALERGIATSACSSIGRLFDAVAALLDVCERCSFEGEAAMGLQFLAEQAAATPVEPYPLPIVQRDLLEFDWRPTLSAILADIAASRPAPVIAASFHESLVHAVVSLAEHLQMKRVVLSGGCFQNRWLSTRLRNGLEARGLEVWAASRVPANDGGLSLGQAWLAVASSEAVRPCV
jgi:hydrogenase maturation protein HypF